MPISKYFGGHGSEVMANMTKEYGAKKAKRVFYATDAKQNAGGMAAHLNSMKASGKLKSKKKY